MMKDQVLYYHLQEGGAKPKMEGPTVFSRQLTDRGNKIDFLAVSSLRYTSELCLCPNTVN